MIQLYSVGNTDYDNNGDITLFPSAASVHVILNSAWTAQLSHPIDAEGRWKYITEEAVVKMPSFNGDQLFRIKKIAKNDSEISADMEPIFYDSIDDCFLTDIRPTGLNGQQALTVMLSPNSKYSAQSDISTATTAYYQYVNFLEALNGDIDQAFTKRWGGEILFDNFTVIVNEHVGGDYGVEIRYGKNISQDGMSYEVDIRDVVTRIYPKAYNGREMSNHGHIDSQYINNYPVIKAKTMTFDNVKLAEDIEGDPSDTDIVCQTQQELDNALTAQCQAQYAAGIDKPSVTISVSMVLLQDTEQYQDIKELETVSIGDTVRCINTHLGIATEARIIELEYDSTRKSVSSVVIGDFSYQYFNDVTSSIDRIQQAIKPDGTVMAEKIQGILDGIYTQLRIQSTAAQPVDGVAFKVEELDEDAPLYGCMIWGTQGIQISTTRTADGKDWDWTTAVTAKGIIADAIITGILADKTASNYWNLDTGEFSLKSSAFKIDGKSPSQFINSSLTQQEIFNKLTNNGAVQGLFLQGGQLYFNGQYIQSKTVTSEQIKIEDTESTGEKGIKIILQNASYTLLFNNEPIAFFGYKEMNDSGDVYVLPKLVMGGNGYSADDDYFGIVPYLGNSDNPQQTDNAYVDIYYHETTHNDSSNIKMYDTGDIRISPVRDLEITTNYANEVYEDTVENRLALFTTSSDDAYNSNLQIGAIANHSNQNGLVLADRHADQPWGDGSYSGPATMIRIQTDSNGDKFVRPLDGYGDINLGSTNFPFKDVVAAGSTMSASGVFASPVQTIQTMAASDPIAADSILDRINVFERPSTYSISNNDESNSGSNSAGLILDASQIINTGYVTQDGYRTYINETEMIKLLIMEIKNLKNQIKGN